MVQGDGVLTKSRLFWSLILDRSLVTSVILETSAILQFRLTQFLCYISPEERIAVEVKSHANVSFPLFVKLTIMFVSDSVWFNFISKDNIKFGVI